MLVMPFKKRLFSWTHLLSELQLIHPPVTLRIKILPLGGPVSSCISFLFLCIPGSILPLLVGPRLHLLIVPLPSDSWLQGPQLCAPFIVTVPQIHSSRNTHWTLSLWAAVRFRTHLFSLYYSQPFSLPNHIGSGKPSHILRDNCFLVYVVDDFS